MDSKSGRKSSEIALSFLMSTPRKQKRPHLVRAAVKVFEAIMFEISDANVCRS
jgi:hypothetical protein